MESAVTSQASDSQTSDAVEHLEHRFTRVYTANLWLDGESISGPGSRVDSDPVVQTLNVLKLICHRFAIQSIADIPCGDLNWMSLFIKHNPGISYAGFDIVRPLIERNRQTYPDIACSFLDITQSVPPAADLILCKDLAIHLETIDIRKMLANIKASGSRYLLLSNNFGLPNSDLNEELYGDSVCRYVDILTPPFNSSPPLWRSDYLGLWQLSDAILE